MRNSRKKSDYSWWFGTVVSGAAVLVSGVLYQSAIAATITVDGGESLPGLVALGEWNTDGDLEGWAPNFVNHAAVSGGRLSGESLGDGSFPDAWDPMFSSPTGLGLFIGNGPGEIDRIQFALQMPAGSPVVRTELFIFTPGHTSWVWTGAAFPSITDGNMHTYTITLDSSDPVWGATIDWIRLDPVADNPNQVEAFAYDYVRAGNSAIPEPSTIALSFLAVMIGMIATRLGNRMHSNV